MILVELNGGLGNQMFQFAAAKSLSLYRNVDLKLDSTSAAQYNLPEGLKKRPYDLHHFNITDPIANKKDIDFFLDRSLVNKIIEKSKPPYKRRIYREPFFHFDKNFFKAGPNVYLKGLWQSEKYFLPYHEEIRKAFHLNNTPFRHLLDIADKIKNENSVSIHIRRGDYLAKAAFKVLGLMPIDHYLRAINIIKSRIDNPHFYFFSDDINWVKENLPLPDAVYISDNLTENHLEDLYLMSQCNHNITANSSFSWWGAWLNNNPGKIVIAPKNWFNKGPKDTYDLYPDNWIVI